MPDTVSPLARTPLHHWHAAHGARFKDRDGWQVVAEYAGVEHEAGIARAGVGLADISDFVKLSLRGPGMPSQCPSLRPRGVIAVTDEPALACRLTDDHLLLLAATPTASALNPQVVGLQEGRAVVRTDVTSTYAAFAVVGPRLEQLLRRLNHQDIRPTALPVNSCVETALAGVEALLVRHETRSLPVLWVLVAWDLGEYVWERMMEAGRDLSIVPIGLEALRSL
jgi:sarcosine oxidase subunit alpha